MVGPDTPEESSWAAPTSKVRDAGPVLPLPGLALAMMTRRHDPGASLSMTRSMIESRGHGHVEIGRYLVLKEIGTGGEIGQGGMGLVLAAYDPDLDRKVALKILREGVRDGSVGAMRMRREAQAMAKLSHPNVAQVYEVAEDAGVLFLAMEYIEGKTLREWRLSATRSWQEILKVYIDAGRGLAAAHAAGLLHRDFKPDLARPSQPAPLPTDRPHSRELGRSERVDVCLADPGGSGLAQILAIRWQHRPSLCRGRFNGAASMNEAEGVDRAGAVARQSRASMVASMNEAEARRARPSFEANGAVSMNGR